MTGQPPDSPQRLLKAVLQSLAGWQDAGVRQIRRVRLPEPAAGRAAPAPPPAPAARAASSTATSHPMPAKPSPTAAAPSVVYPVSLVPLSQLPPLSLEQRCAALVEIQEEVAACKRCQELARTRSKTVFGVGNPQPRVCFMGEAPGADEDREGEPFVGKAGQLLTKILAACGWQRSDVYILNTIKCRPPGNRNPLPDEAAHCSEYLHRQLEALRPEFICCLGAVASMNLLQTTVSIGRLRGKFHSFRGAKVLCTFHPSYLLRNPSAKKDVWDDMKMLLAEMGLSPPERNSPAE